MSRDPRIALEFMAEAVDEIVRLTSNISFDEFQNSWLIRSAVQRGLEVISEASRHVPMDLKDTENDVPWWKVAALGNVLRHEYHRVDDEIIWLVVTDDLPELGEAVRRMMLKVASN